MIGTDRLDELLLGVQKPARYIGGEWNSVKKEWRADRIKFLLAFPDVYEVGMSYLGLKILYGLINEREDALAERLFTPWPDFEDSLRKNGVELFSLESRRPMKEFDIIGFSLTYELTYTNVLTMLDLGGIPLWARERSDEDPLVIAGGPSCYNPEPVADFFDAIVIGEGEEVLGEIIEAYKVSRGKGGRSRRDILRELAKIPGVYVPSFYSVEYNDDSTIKNFRPIEKGVCATIEKRFVRDLERSYFPTAQLVPYLQTVHDRIQIEILRGCRYACKFCLSGATYRPWRERSKERILGLAKEAYEKTGYEEISLLSLSSCDHSRIKEIIAELNTIFRNKAVSISVPSLRIRDVTSDLPFLISQVRKTGLTFAPESGSESLRRFINKNIDMDDLFKAAKESFKAGWHRVKLYFMIGLPTESESDLLSIVELAEKISDLKREVDGRRAAVTASINAFVPKPHTPLQWRGMEDLKTLYEKKDMLKKRPRARTVELDFNSFERGYIEAVFSRGDRRLAAAVYDAWKEGARFDSWLDHFKIERWLGSLERSGLDAGFYATRQRDQGEILPWDFIDTGSSKENLNRQAGFDNP